MAFQKILSHLAEHSQGYVKDVWVYIWEDVQARQRKGQYPKEEMTLSAISRFAYSVAYAASAKEHGNRSCLSFVDIKELDGVCAYDETFSSEFNEIIGALYFQSTSVDAERYNNHLFFMSPEHNENLHPLFAQPEFETASSQLTAAKAMNDIEKQYETSCRLFRMLEEHEDKELLKKALMGEKTL